MDSSIVWNYIKKSCFCKLRKQSRKKKEEHKDVDISHSLENSILYLVLALKNPKYLKRSGYFSMKMS